MSAIYEFIIKESHLDTFGHVNNATYLTLFEEARWELISQRGYGLDYIKLTGLGPVILEIQIRFQKELLLRQKIKVETTLLNYEGKIGKLRQTMINEKGETCCSAELTFGLFDTKLRKLVAPTAEWRRAIE
ncbi:MAG: hypothetical protein RJB66_918 [Pseudomonadota bacterium]|jgi:acyl-CoA thioester hydrolase